MTSVTKCTTWDQPEEHASNIFSSNRSSRVVTDVFRFLPGVFVFSGVKICAIFVGIIFGGNIFFGLRKNRKNLKTLNSETFCTTGFRSQLKIALLCYIWCENRFWSQESYLQLITIPDRCPMLTVVNNIFSDPRDFSTSLLATEVKKWSKSEVEMKAIL